MLCIPYVYKIGNNFKSTIINKYISVKILLKPKYSLSPSYCSGRFVRMGLLSTPALRSQPLACQTDLALSKLSPLRVHTTAVY